MHAIYLMMDASTEIHYHRHLIDDDTQSLGDVHIVCCTLPQVTAKLKVTVMMELS